MSEIQEKQEIVIIGGGVIGCTTAYYLTRHPKFVPEKHNITLLEATGIAAAASGKAGGFLASWAHPCCIAPLSFNLHEQLAKEHDGEKCWGYRRVRCGRLSATGRQTPEGAVAESLGQGGDRSQVLSKEGENPLKTWKELSASRIPGGLDWLLPETVKSFKGVSDTNAAAQVQPYLFTNGMARLAKERGVKFILGSVKEIDFVEAPGAAQQRAGRAACATGRTESPTLPGSQESLSRRRVSSVRYVNNATSKAQTIPATTVILAAGPWTSSLFPWAPIYAVPAHSTTIRLKRQLPGYCLYTRVTVPRSPAGDSLLQDNESNASSPTETRTNIFSPEILTRPNNEVYICGPEDHNVPLPAPASRPEMPSHQHRELINAAASISEELRDGIVTSECASYLPVVLSGGSNGPLLGPTGVKGLLLASAHGCWGIQNAPASGKLISEIIFDGEAKSADITSLDPRVAL